MSQILSSTPGNSVHADVRSAGEEDLVDDPELSSLKEDYLKIREERLKNIAFNANATYGGTIKEMRKNYHRFFLSRNYFAIQPPSCPD